MVADLHALLAEVGEAGPYVVVGHSAGALNGRLYASTYPDEVAGMVLIDPSHEEQNVQRQALLSPEHWAIYQQMNLDIEGIDLDASFAQVKDARAAAPLRSIPLVVMTAGQGADPALLPPGWPVAEDEQLWHDLHADLAELVPNARHVVADQSGHYIHQSQPDLVVESIRSVVDAVRDPDSWSTPIPGATPASGG
jgi:pimeloyl-ACP methyl ester carboxylesterase